jgi:hypothetical protein
MNSILNIQIDVPERVQTKIEAAQIEIERATGFPPSVNELYIFTLTQGVEDLAQEYIDAVIIAHERSKQRDLPLSDLAPFSK